VRAGPRCPRAAPARPVLAEGMPMSSLRPRPPSRPPGGNLAISP